MDLQELSVPLCLSLSRSELFVHFPGHIDLQDSFLKLERFLFTIFFSLCLALRSSCNRWRYAGVEVLFAVCASQSPLEWPLWNWHSSVHQHLNIRHWCHLKHLQFQKTVGHKAKQNKSNDNRSKSHYNMYFCFQVFEVLFCHLLRELHLEVFLFLDPLISALLFW